MTRRRSLWAIVFVVACIVLVVGLLLSVKLLWIVGGAAVVFVAVMVFEAGDANPPGTYGP